MATDINGQVIRSYAPDGGALQEEIQNQQLNDALAAGTVDGILMKTGYSAVYDHHVVIKKNLASFVTITDVIDQIGNTNVYDFGDYSSSKKLYIKSNSDASSQSVPTTSHITRRGEIAVDNFDGSLYLLGNAGADVVKVDAGTVNGFVIQKDVLSGAGGTAMMTRDEIKALINSAFDYNSGSNTLTISAV